MTPRDPSWAELEDAGSSTAPRVVPTTTTTNRGHGDAKGGVRWLSEEQTVEKAQPWVWLDYIPQGAVTELDGKVKSSGKTTFACHLARAVLDGEPFLDRATMKGPVVYLTEEGRSSWDPRAENLGIADHPDLHVISKRENPRATWADLVEAARDRMVQTKAVLLIVDTFAKLCGLKDKDENYSGPVMAALDPLLVLASALKVGILITRHEKSAGGEITESGRGSTALTGEMDQVLQLKRVGGMAHESERWLNALGRYEATPDHLKIRLEDGRYRCVDKDEAAAQAGRALLQILEPGTPRAVVDMLPELSELGHSAKAVYAAVNRFALSGELSEVWGEGKHGHSRKLIEIQSFRALQKRESVESEGVSGSGLQSAQIQPFRAPHPRSGGSETDEWAAAETSPVGVSVPSPGDVLRVFPGARPAELDAEGGL
jgi:hypothetical protein